MTNYTIATSASLHEKAEALELLAAQAETPGHAAIYLRVAMANRSAAILAKLAETTD